MGRDGSALNRTRPNAWKDLSMERETPEELALELEQLRERLVKKDREIERLRRDRLFLEALLDGVSEEILIVDSDFIIQDANRTFLERYELDKANVVGKKCYEVKARTCAPCSMPNQACPLEKSLQTGGRVEMTHYHEFREGETGEFRVTMCPLVAGDKEGVERFIEIAREVTDYRELVLKLQTSQKHLRAILDTATSAILSVDENHRIVLFNNAAEKIFGYSRKEILGEDVGRLIPPRYGNHERFEKGFLKRKKSRFMGKTLSMTGLRRDGEEFPIELSLSSMEMDGKFTFTAIIKDLSDQKQLEKKLLQSERLAAVGQAVAHVAHEIKNPLMIIGGFSNQMRRGLTDQRDLNKLDLILEEVHRLERLVAGLGDFTKSYKLVMRTTDINAVLRDVIKIMSEVYPVEQYGFKEYLSRHLDEINCDPDKLKQVFINIISNGFEAMAEGGAVTISTQAASGGVEIRISDDGVGIPEEDLQHIFEPFYTTRKRGSGLGLAISYKIIEAHHGDIWAISRPGKGTTFVIHLPSS